MKRRPGARDVWLVSVLASFASAVSFTHYFLINEILMYGDAVAHINIARRVFDSRTPGLAQLGTVWLPLPHLLTIPFIVNDWMWRTGVGGSIPSMIAYVAGVAGVFRLVRDNLQAHPRARLAAWIAAAVYGANPNLLYMQATAMTESLSLALFVWAVVFFSDFARRVQAGEAVRRAERSLWWCALTLSGEMLTRYDGWFAACALAGVLLVFLLRRSSKQDGEKGALAPKTGTGNRQEGTGTRGVQKGVLVRFVLLISLVPIFWFTYNYRLFGNPLEFATGQYSAKAIAERTSRAGQPPYPGKDRPATAAVYFVKSGVLNLGGSRLEGEYGWWWRKRWQQDGWYFLLLAGTVCIVLVARRSVTGPFRSPLCLLLLWIPLPFYSLSIAYGGVPIFIPSWRPYSFYNVRYGLQLLPMAAVCAASAVVYARWWKTVTAVVLVFVVVTYRGSWRTDPVCLREAIVNSRTREQLESKLAEALAQIPPEAAILMYTGEHVGALQRAGVPLKQTINENNYYAWREALRTPGRAAEYAIAFDDDEVAKAVHKSASFEPEQTIEVEGQKTAVIYHRK